MSKYTRIDKAEYDAANQGSSVEALVIIIAGVGREIADGLHSIKNVLSKIERNQGRK